MEATLELGDGEVGTVCRAQKKTGKFKKSLELPRDLFKGFSQTADNDMDNDIQADMVSDGDEELIGNWSKGDSCCVLAKRLVAFCPCPGDLWNFELDRDDLGIWPMKLLSIKAFKR